MGIGNFIVRFFSAIWGGVNGLRKLLHLVLLLFDHRTEPFADIPRVAVRRRIDHDYARHRCKSSSRFAPGKNQ